MARTVEMGNLYIPLSFVGALDKEQLLVSSGKVPVNFMLGVELEAMITITEALLLLAAVGVVELEA